MIHEILGSIGYWSGVFLVIYLVNVMFFYSLLLFISSLQLHKEYGLNKEIVVEECREREYIKPISILVPAYNEEVGIIQSVRSLLSIHYPTFEVIVINDGSSDHTLEKMIQHYDMVSIPVVIKKQLDTQTIKEVYQSRIFPYLYMLDKENGGKGDALNAGLNVSRYPYFCSLDGDSILERDAFVKVIQPIIESGDEVIVAGGSVRIANGCEINNGKLIKVGLSRKPLVIMQTIEYLRAFLMGRIGLSRHNLLLIISGAFGVFSKKWVLEAGGYRHNTLGEDMELVVRLHRLIKEKNLNKKIVFIPDPVCWTEVPEETKYLRRQRRRWHQGLFESLWIHRKILFNKKYGLIGFVSFPYFWIVEFFGPIVEFLGYLYMIVSIFLGHTYLEFGILLFLLSCLYGSIFSMMAVILEEWSLRRYQKLSEILKLFFYSLTETFWYRPLTVIWRVEGVWKIIRGNHSWGEMERKGVSK